MSIAYVTWTPILANRPGTCRIVPENDVPSCSPGNNAKCPAILITLGQRPSFVLLSYIYIHLDLGYSAGLDLLVWRA